MLMPPSEEEVARNLDWRVKHMRTKGGNKSNQNSEVSNMYAEGKDRKAFLLKI